MCRHVAFVGEPVALGELILRPEHGLLRQSWAPRTQNSGVVNADGFGVGWYAEGDPVPARYRRTGPIWSDLSFTDLARVVRSGALLAAVRGATVPGADGEAAAAPFAAGPWLFSHNGAVTGWPGSLEALAGTLSAGELLRVEARTDSALLWALALHRLRSGDAPGPALADTVREVAEAAPGSGLNLLLTDGSLIAATAWGNSLWYLRGPDRVVVASEPYDADPRWQEVPERTLVTATRADVTLTPLKEPSA
ncbi:MULTISPECIES: ergothioneine biosynthesis protein EgtC [Streptomyces]|uniref:Gamma-glutamyl-hercynylcysteine sulfoxide hydrolase n=1 Tax=Streptomyces venezuelae (strain ATCC 10712 / CBS 650.69 / DSM 40230 / JCM 4526 / NBRC 13096 / PD 04745) TaxID=953739 RepID=F2RJ28_STRVP|nr:ergothioneine biosynthesis protein EgtC [Streptomyces venezuelae]APE25526.1 ergothioneine biosynthesis protein EgtC [Streptomyces venezuelae]QES02863.1 ergothioneine biosynthesis protein EgtC [Streptomyces venezuelae ATCC 10712]QES09871.1 ergothioneine biosynthesis protein EgtC [Streptomyces venezuelae]QES11458.1 ergothioneine biosynthesis protein EgtC [Streptomyces venezuelae]CCA60154.1 Glutamine amidotransferases class-II [Streptomyces venezuelae ATCC 10712]